MSGSRLVRRAARAGALWLAACAPPQAPHEPAPASIASNKPAAASPAALVEETEPGLPQLRTGRIQPITHAEPLELKVRRHTIDGDQQLLELVLPHFASEAPGDQFWLGTEARITGSSAPLQLVSRGKDTEMVLWLRRPKAEATGEVAGDAYTPAVGAQPGHHFRFRAAAPSGAITANLSAQWVSKVIEHLSWRSGAFGVTAAARLHVRYKLPGKPMAFDTSSSLSSDELSGLMDTFTGRGAVRAALANHRSLFLQTSKAKRSVAIAEVKGPELSHHPWAELAKRLGGNAPEEPLAKAVPASFYFVRAKSFSAFTETLSFVEDFGAPLADAADRTSTSRGSLPRYLAELGVESGDLSRVLGPEVVRDFAVTGSDPYVHEGSDVTLIFRLKSPLLFRAALVKALATHGAAHGGTTSSSFTHEGITVNVARSADGRVRQHHAVVGDFELVSNSPAAIKRVISTSLGKAPQLAEELDFRYMLARDADVPAEVLAFIGDRFVETVVGPAQKVAEARRQIALSELTAQPIAALLYGWLHGKSPLDTKELLRSGLLDQADMQHQDGKRIDWAPGLSPRSSWGTPAALEPLIDLAPVTQVSLAERDAYASFARQYQGRWSEYIDPIALRLSSNKRGDSKNLHAEMRVLPLVSADQAAQLDLGGDGHVAPIELLSGARFSMGIGEQAYLRHALTQGLGLIASTRADIRLDWLGNYALLGCADRGELVAAARDMRQVQGLPLERPASAQEMGREAAPRNDIAALRGLPVYLVVGLKSQVAAAVALTAAHRMLDESAPGAVDWAPFASHRGVQVVRVMGREDGQDVAVYYAIAGDAFILTFSRSVMRSLIEQAVDGKLPLQGKQPAAMAKEGQVVVELAPNKKGSLRTLLGWALSTAALQAAPQARADAEAVLRGVPESAHKPERSAELSLAYLGSAPLTPDGRRYWLSPEGVADPLRGTAHAPEWPAMPAPGSSTERVLGALVRARSDLSFDEEPQIASNQPRLRSLRARLDLWLR